jgi:hypothetical protein
MCTDRAACSVPWAVLTPVACIAQVNLSTLLTGLGDGSLLCPTTSALGATVARSDAYDSAMQELARVQTENVNLRAEVDCLVHVRAENVSLRAEVHRARQQVKRSTQSVLVELDNMSTASETMQAGQAMWMRRAGLRLDVRPSTVRATKKVPIDGTSSS